MRRQLTAIFLVLCLIFTALPIHAADNESAPVSFSDTAEHWAQNAIDTWSLNGIVHGSDGLFRPNDAVTRAELAAILNRVIGYKALSSASFSDVPAGAWYAGDISKLNAAGVMTGDGGGTMRPSAYITREEAAVMFARAFDLAPQSAGTQADYTTFKDHAALSDWAKDAVSALKERGYISGDTAGSFNPKLNLTRAEAVTILNNMVSAYYAAPGEVTGDIEGNVVVSSTDVTLKDMKISGDLYIMEGVGEGDVTLENVEVFGTVFARGGGPNSLRFNNCTITELVAIKDKLHIVFENGSKVTLLRSELQDGLIELNNCAVETMIVLGDGLDIKLSSGTAIKVLNADANGIKVEGAAGTSIGTANLNGVTEISGHVSTGEAIITIDGCEIEKAPGKVSLEKDVTATIAGKKQTDGSSPSSDGGSSGGGGSVSYRRHNVPDMNSIPYNTAVDQLGLPTEATLTASNGSSVTVSLNWNEAGYNKTKTDGAQTLTAAVSARPGTSLPSWAPETISISVRVLPMPTPTTFELCEAGLSTPITSGTISKGSQQSYTLRIKDENGTAMSLAQLTDAGVTFTFDTATTGITITNGSDLTVTIAVDSAYVGAAYAFAPSLTFTANGGGTLGASMLIATPAPPSVQVAAAVDLSLYTYSVNGISDAETLNFMFNAPADITGIDRFYVRFTNVATPENFTYFSTFSNVTANQSYNFYIISDLQHLPSGTYKIEVISVAMGSDRSLDNTALCEQTIALTNLGDLQSKLFLEQAVYTFDADMVSLAFDYHYFGMPTPNIDTFIIDVYFEGGPRYAPDSWASYEHGGKGRIQFSPYLAEGEVADMNNLRVFINRYTLTFDEQEGIAYLGLSYRMPITDFEELTSELQARPEHDGDSGINIYRPLATSFEALELPDTVTLYAPVYATLDVLWQEEDYDPTSTGEQEIRGYIVVDAEAECPAWIPAVVIAKVTLS